MRFQLIIHGDSIIVKTKKSFEAKFNGKRLAKAEKSFVEQAQMSPTDVNLKSSNKKKGEKFSFTFVECECLAGGSGGDEKDDSVKEHA